MAPTILGPPVIFPRGQNVQCQIYLPKTLQISGKNFPYKYYFRIQYISFSDTNIWFDSTVFTV
jgi:hypothetical protein